MPSFEDEFSAYLKRRAAERPRGHGFVGSDEGRVLSLHDDGTFEFRKRSGQTVTVEDARFRPYYAANH